jgi:FkbM family methyltransferase
MKALLKRVYNSIPFKKQIFTALKTVYSPSESVYKHLHFHGVIEMKVDKNVKFKMNHFGFQIENEIFWKGLDGGWEKNSVTLWIKLSKNAKTIIDIGANTGIFALIAKTVQPSAKVYAFEPIKRVHKKLHENILLNNYDIKSYPLAVSNNNGKAYVYDNPEIENVYSVTVNSYMNAADLVGKTKTEIDIITLDSFIEDNQITSIDLLKIDVETHEGEVMEGFMKHLPVFKPTFLIEILRNEVGEKVQHCLEGLGYLFFNIDESGDIVKVDKITRRGHNYNYLLCSSEVAKHLGLKI